MVRRKPRKRVFLGSEGISERNYGQYLRIIADKHNLQIHLDCDYTIGGGDPLTIVEESIKLLNRNTTRHGEYWVKAIMLDSDKLGDKAARDNLIPTLIKRNNIKLIYSTPNFEALLLRHFRGCENRIPPAKKSLNELRKVWPNYTKGVDANSLYRQLREDGLWRAVNVEDDLRDFLKSIGFRNIR